MKDPETEEDLGMSKNAAKTAITTTALSRAVYAFPMFFIPALCNIALTKANLLPKKMGPTRVILECMGVGLGLYIAMPVNCALYP